MTGTNRGSDDNVLSSDNAPTSGRIDDEQPNLPGDRGQSLEARSERRLSQWIAPLGRFVRHTRYLGKWVLLGGLIGIVAGLGAVVFYLAIRWGTHLFQGGLAGYTPPLPAGEGATRVFHVTHMWLLPLSTTLGGLLAGFVVVRFAPEAEGHGTDAAIAAFHQHAGQMRPIVPLVKLVASAITLGSGGSGGREGPTAQISAGFGAFLGAVLRLDVRDRRIAVATGIGSGIAAIFRAPLGGAILASELLYRRDFEPDALVPSLVASIVGYTIFASVFGWTPVFGNQPGLTFTHPIQLLYYAVLGVAVGLIGILYIRVFYGTQRLFSHVPLSPYLKPALGGLLVGLIGLGVPQAIGVGYGWVQFLMRPNQVAIPLVIVLLLPLIKIVTTSLSIGSGGSAGIFGPGLVIGAGVGASFWALFHHVLPGMPPTPAAFVVVAMMSLFGGVAHAPLAMMLMVGEMTGSYGLLAPAMITVSIASLVVGDRTIYTSQPETRAQSPAHRFSYAFPLLQALTVGQAMTTPKLVLRPELSLQEGRDRMRAADLGEALVAQEDQTLVGMVTERTLARAADEGAGTVGQAALTIPGLQRDASLDAAMGLLAQYRVQRLPVVDSDHPNCLIGALTMESITRAYATHTGSDLRQLSAVAPDLSLRDIVIPPGARAMGREIRHLGLPAQALIVAIHRQGETVLPRGRTTIEAGDTLTVLSTPEEAGRLHTMLVG